MKVTANGWTTELPPGWDDRSMITLVGPVGSSGFAVNIVVTREQVDPDTSVEDYAHEQRAAIQGEVEGYEILDERPTTVGGAPAYQRLQSFQIEGEQLQQVQTFVLGDRVMFVITGTATVADFDDNTPAFRRVVEAFSLFDLEPPSA